MTEWDAPASGHIEGDKEPSTLVLRIDALQKRQAPLGFAWAVLKKFGEDKASHLAALVAYFGFFSIFPLLVAMVSTLGFVLEGNESLREEISDAAFGQIPIVGQTLAGTIDEIEGNGVVLVLGIAAALWAGLRIVDATQNAMNGVWDLPREKKASLITRRAKGVATLVVIFVGLVGGIAISTIASVLPDLVGSGRLAVWAGTLALNMALYTLLFRLLTDADLPWRAHVTGGVLAGACWWLMQEFGVVYLSRVEENAGPTYGSFASTIVLLTFIYLSAQLIILSAEIGVVRHRRLWPRAVPRCELTDADIAAWELQARSTRQVPAQVITSEVPAGTRRTGLMNTDAGERRAGSFPVWIRGMRSALAGRSESDVPCGDCDACCRSGYFIHIGPGEKRTLDAVPSEYVVAAPGMPAGTMVMGFDQEGRCPMLGDDGCSIYADRPATCRTYDCRVFPAAGVDPSGEKPLVGAVAAAWEFDFPTPGDRVEFMAIHTAAEHLATGGGKGDHERPANATQLAMAAVDIGDLFVERDASGRVVAVATPSAGDVRAALDRRRR